MFLEYITEIYLKNTITVKFDIRVLLWPADKKPKGGSLSVKRTWVEILETAGQFGTVTDGIECVAGAFGITDQMIRDR